jgi:hypothetical protein
METISDIATNPNFTWKAQTGNGGWFTNTGNPARFIVIDPVTNKIPIVNGVPIKVIVEPAGEGIITAYPKY